MRKNRLNAPRPKEKVREIYDSLAARYDSKFRLMEWVGVQKLRKRLLCHAQGDVLEVAVGTGINLPHYPTGCNLTAIDFSPEMIGRAKVRARQMGLEAKFLVMDAGHLTFRDGRFDAVVSTLSICTFPNPVAAIREMRRVLRPDGIVLLLEQGYGTPGWVRALQKMQAKRRLEVFGCRWDRDPEREAVEAGLRVEENSSHFFGCLHAMRLRPGVSPGEESPLAKPSQPMVEMP